MAAPTVRASILAPAQVLYRRTTWYIILRLILATILFGIATYLIMQQPGTVDDRYKLFSLVVVSYGILGSSLALQPRIKNITNFVAVQLISDAAIITALVFMTGGPSSIFVILYFMNIVAAAYMGYGRLTLATAALDTAFFVLMIVLANTGLLPLGFEGETNVETYAELMLKIFGFLLVGSLTGQLAERVRAADEALLAQIRTTRALEEVYGLIFQSVHSGILTVGPNGVIQGSNPAARDALGLCEGRAIGIILTGIQPGDARQEVLVRGPNGLKNLLLHRAPLGADGSEVVVFEDVTQLRLMQAESEREERLVGVGRISAAIAHEIRNPLASLSGAVQLMREESPGPLMDIVLREIHRLNDLVGDFLEVSRTPRIAFKPTDVHALVQDVMANFRHDPRYGGLVTLSATGDCGGRFMLDPDRLQQILWNLFLNAAQAMTEGGPIDVSLSRSPVGLRVQVKDRGPGISPDEREHLFDPFHTTRRGGTGLGLVTVQRLVKAHGGTIEVQSTSTGTAFNLFFPERTLPGEDVESPDFGVSP